MTSLRDRIRLRLEAYSPETILATDRIPAAVLVPLFDKHDHPHLLFTKRTNHLQYHRGEICFPGGSRDAADVDLQATAIRELREEIDVPHSRIEILGRLDDIRAVSSSFLVSPYVGYLQSGTWFRPNKEEVEELLEIPFQHFENASIFREEERLVDGKPHAVYYYRWNSHTIWGLTARVLKTLLDVLQGEKND